MIAFDDMRGFIQLLKIKDQLKEIDIEKQRLIYEIQELKKG